MTRPAQSKSPKTPKPFRVSYDRVGRFFKPDDKPQVVEETMDYILKSGGHTVSYRYPHLDPRHRIVLRVISEQLKDGI